MKPSRLPPRTRKRTHHVLLAHRLLAIEASWHQEKATLLSEITRLRLEVSTLTKRYRDARREIQDMVVRLKAQPAPAVPRRPDNDGGGSDVDVQEATVGRKGKGKMKEVGRKRAGQERPLRAATPLIPAVFAAAAPHRLSGSKSEPVMRKLAQLTRKKSDEKAWGGRPEMVKDDPEGSESERNFAKFVEIHAERWEDVVRGFAHMLDEEEEVNGLKWYEEYKGEKEWDVRLIGWAKWKKGESLTAVDRICWQGRYLEGVELFRVGKQLRLWKKI